MEPEIKIVFQPIFSTDTMEIYAYEELMRFPNDTIDNVISPTPGTPAVPIEASVAVNITVR